MSTIKATTLSNLAGSKTVPMDTVVDGSAKAWVNFNGTGTVAIRRAFNVSSITDNGTGDYTVNFTSSMPDVNYSVVQGYTPSSSAAYVGQVSTLALGSVRMGSYLNYASGASLDMSMVSVAIFS